MNRETRRKMMKQKRKEKECTCPHCSASDKLIDEIARMMNIYFGFIDVKDCTCEDCRDFKMKVCQGESRKGIACGMCIEDKVRRGIR